LRVRAPRQIRCGDLYADPVVKDFNTCAVTTKKCVPQRADNGAFPEPKADALVKAFDTTDMTGRWYISAGLNPLFDLFDCQARVCVDRSHCSRADLCVCCCVAC
jgi:violaxanthin de-epoxidase